MAVTDKISDIDRKIEELQRQREAVLQQALEEERIGRFDEAVGLIGDLVANLERLHSIGYLPPRLLEALSNEKRKFSPGLYIKKPRRVRSVDALEGDEPQSSPVQEEDPSR